MELYHGSFPAFAEATRSNQIAELLSQAYAEWFGRAPGEPEVRAWNNSLVRVKDALEGAVTEDTGVILEYELPLSSLRLDCMVTGFNSAGTRSAEIVELKQWEACRQTSDDELVITYLDGRNRPVLHPSAQVARYEQFLRDGNEAFYGASPIKLESCSYLHNYRLKPQDPITDTKFRQLIALHPLFTANDFDRLQDRLHAHVGFGSGLEILSRIRSSKIAPSKQFLRYVGKVLKRVPAFTLLDEQVVTFNTVLRLVKESASSAEKHCVVVRGGPGTGKSVIAVNLLAELAHRGFNSRYATGSKAFTTTLRRIAGPRAASQFDYTLSYSRVSENYLDALVVDEAHRIRRVTASRWTPKASRTGAPQVEELLKAARVTVFFIDDLQAIRPDEIGTSGYIIENAKRLGIPISEFDLEIQFRCQGSDRFVSWIDEILGLGKLGSLNYHASPAFDLRVFDSPIALEAELRARLAENSTARMTAGFCWPWSDPLPDGNLVEDVRIGEYHRAWNAKPDVGRLSRTIPRAPLWAYSPQGIDQIGCVYTAQGFDFDYVGVIVGPDLALSEDGLTLAGKVAGSADRVVKRAGDRGKALIARAYRILFSRGMKGCYVTFTDPDVRRFFQSHIAPS